MFLEKLSSHRELRKLNLAYLIQDKNLMPTMKEYQCSVCVFILQQRLFKI